MPSYRTHPPSLWWAWGLSLLCHALILLEPWSALPVPPPPAPVLHVQLPPAQIPEAATPLLKDTLAKDDEQRPTPLATPKKAPGPARRLSAQHEQRALRKLAERLYYPEEAIQQAWEGEVRLLIQVDADGNLAAVDVASGSGHAILDQAAVRAARSIGRLPQLDVRQFILPVIFRLQ